MSSTTGHAARDFAEFNSHPDGSQAASSIKDDKEYDNDNVVELGARATNLPYCFLSQEHRDYLIHRHGALDLDPVPSMDPADPYNWPSWKKAANLFLVAFHAFMTTFTAAAIIPVFEDMAEEFGGSLTKMSYLVSLQIVILGIAPLFWKPIANYYGRRPVWLISTIGSLLFNVGCALSPDYTTMAICRAFCAFFISPPGGIGSGVVTETYFKTERAKFMGVWTLLVTLGPPMGPFIMGFVAFHTGDWRWVYWVLTIINGVQFIAYLFLGPETRYIRQGVRHTGSALKQEYLTFKRIDPKPFKVMEFFQPLTLFKYASIVIPTITYAIVFNFTSVLMTVEIPQLFVPKFHFNPQQLGLQFLGNIIGSIIGEQIGGRLSDYWMNRRERKIGQRPPPEYRLWLSYIGFVLVIIGVLVFGIRIEQAPVGHWNVTPIIGVAIAATGNQIVTTVLVTYAVDCHLEFSASIGVFVNAVRSTWGFIGPFWFPVMLENLGGARSGGLMAGIVFGASLLPIVLLQSRGYGWRLKHEVAAETKEDEPQVNINPN